MFVKEETMLQKKRLIGITLTLILAFLPLLLSSPASALAEEPGIICERLDLRTENTRAYQLDNGQIRYEVFASDIYYRDSAGRLAEIDNTIVKSDRAGFSLANAANSYRVFFAEDLASAAAVRIEYGNSVVSFALAGAACEGVAPANSLTAADEHEQALFDDRRAVVYRSALPNVDMIYTVMNQCLKEDIVLLNKNAPNEFTFKMAAPGLTALLKNGQVILSGEDGQPVFVLDSPFMEDAAGQRTGKVTCSLAEIPSGFEVKITADRQFLDDPKTVFPVVIDPTTIVQGSSVTFDSYVCSLQPDNNYYLNVAVRTGKDTYHDVRRTYIKFTLPDLPDGSNITNAWLALNLSDSAGTQNPDAYIVTGAWTSSTITWNNKPGYTSDYAATTHYINGAWYSLNVLDAVDRWYNQIYANNGFCVKDYVETSYSVWGTWHSSDSASASLRPKLTIDYDTPYPDSRTLDVKCVCDETFATDYPDKYTVMQDDLETADYPFRERFNLIFNPALSIFHSEFPADDCSFSNHSYCTNAVCGSLCSNTSYEGPPFEYQHHKNGYYAFDYSRTFLLCGCDFQLLYLGHVMCGNTDTVHFTGLLGLSELNGQYCMARVINTTSIKNIRVMQHEISHLFGMDDDACTAGQPCICHGGFDNISSFQNRDIWCAHHAAQFDRNETF
jgi:hypothetical protein